MTATRTAMIMMAVTLAAVTITTAVESFAAPKKKKAVAAEQAADSVQLTSQRIIRLKIRAPQPSSPD